MRIHIKSADQNLRLWFPTNLVFSRTVAAIVARYGLKYAGDVVKNMPPEAIRLLFGEFRRIKRTYGSLDLVEIVSADGQEQIKITL